MPTEIEIDAIINTDRSEQTLRQLNKSLKELISLQSQVAAGSEQFKRLQSAINETEGKIGDLNDSFQTLKGSGVERLNASLGLLREGFLTADPEKLATGMNGLGAAMKAIPVFLLITGITLLIENFDKFKSLITDTRSATDAQARALELLNQESDRQNKLLEVSNALLNENIQTNNILLDNLVKEGKNRQEILDILDKTETSKQEQLRNDLERNRTKTKAAEDDIELARAELIFFRNSLSERKQQYQDYSEEEKKIFSDLTKRVKDGQNSVEVSEREKQIIIQKSQNSYREYLKTIKDVNKEISDNDEATRRKIAALQIQDIFDSEEREVAARKEQYKEEQYDNKLNAGILRALAIAFENDMDEIRKKYGAIRAARASEDRNREQQYQEDKARAELDAQRKLDQELIDEYEYLKNTLKLSDEEANKQLENKRINRQRNQLAFESTFQKQSLDEKILFIEQERDTLLLNEELTQKQRIAIIEKAENDILQLKVAKAQEYLAYAQQGNSILNSLAEIQTQNQAYQLQEQSYKKDEAIQKDADRTQQEIDREELKKNQLLNNDQLTSEERERISYESETRQLAISNASKNTQAKLLEDFNKKETEIRKKQFERNKALQIVTGIINTAASVLQTLAAVPYPANIPLAVLAGIAGAAQVAVIATQKFDAGPNVSSASTSIDTRGGISSGGGGFSSSSPSPQSPVPFDPNGQANAQTSTVVTEPVKVYVLESDIRNVTNKIDVIETRATF